MPSQGTKLYCLVAEVHRCEQLAQGCYAASPRVGSKPVTQSREWVDGSWVMGQMGHENRMGHVGHGSLGVDP